MISHKGIQTCHENIFVFRHTKYLPASLESGRGRLCDQSLASRQLVLIQSPTPNAGGPSFHAIELFIRAELPTTPTISRLPRLVLRDVFDG
ncbi:hypothetical protein V2G26_011062 [Clonostachys chloroleuca]